MESAESVSVVIPTFGRPALVARAAATALGQTVPPLEVLVVADGHDPRTREAVEGLADQRCRYLELPVHQGASAARNMGVAEAGGTLVAFLDDDDEWLPTKLERQLAARASASPGLPIVACRVVVRTPRAAFVLPRRPPLPTEPLSEWLTVRHGLFHGEGFIQTSTLLAPRSLLQDTPFDELLPRLQEVDWVLRALTRPGTSLTMVDDPLVIWHADEDRPRISEVTDWRTMLRWAEAHRELFTDRAFAALLLSIVAAMAAPHRDRIAFRTLLQQARRRGRPTLVDYLTYLQIWLIPGGARRRIRDAVLGRGGHAIVPPG